MKQTINLENGRSVVLIAPPEASYLFLKSPLIEVHMYGVAVASFNPTAIQLNDLIQGLQKMQVGAAV